MAGILRRRSRLLFWLDWIPDGAAPRLWLPWNLCIILSMPTKWYHWQWRIHTILWINHFPLGNYFFAVLGTSRVPVVISMGNTTERIRTTNLFWSTHWVQGEIENISRDRTARSTLSTVQATVEICRVCHCDNCHARRRVYSHDFFVKPSRLHRSQTRPWSMGYR